MSLTGVPIKGTDTCCITLRYFSGTPPHCIAGSLAWPSGRVDAKCRWV